MGTHYTHLAIYLTSNVEWCCSISVCCLVCVGACLEFVCVPAGDVVGCCWMSLYVVVRRGMLLDVAGCCSASLDVVLWCWVSLDVVGHLTTSGHQQHSSWMDVEGRALGHHSQPPMTYIDTHLMHVIGCFWILSDAVGCCWRSAFQ